VCDRQCQTAAQNISGGAAGNDRDHPGGVRVLHSVLSWLVYSEAYYIFWSFLKIISEMSEFMPAFYLSKREMTDVSADVTLYYI